MLRPLLHEVEADLSSDIREQMELLRERHNLPSYEEYLSMCKLGDTLSLTRPTQKLAWSVYYFMKSQHCSRELPNHFVINLTFAKELLNELGKIPQEFEGVTLVFEPEGLFPHTLLL